MRAKTILFRIAVALLSLYAIVHISVQLISSLTTDVRYQTTEKVVLNDFLETTGYIFRNEVVLYASEEGILNYAVTESQKVGINQPIATVFANSQGVDMQQKLDRLDKRIEVLERSSVDTNYLTSDLGKIDTEISSAMTKLRIGVDTGDLSLAAQYKEELTVNLNKRALITSGEANYNTTIEKLKEERTALTASLENPLSTVYANSAGYFSTLLDGYEGIYNSAQLDSLTVDGFHNLTATEQTKYEKNAIGKIIVDFDWFTVCELSSHKAENFRIGAEYEVSYLYSGSESLTAVLQSKVSQTDSDSVLLVFRIEEVPQDFDYTRVQTIKISQKTVSGYTFPQSALRVVDGMQGVYIVVGNSVEFRKVDIIYATGSEYFSKTRDQIEAENKKIAEENENNKDNPDYTEKELKKASEYLSVHDQVIVSGKELYVGKILK